MTRQAGFSLLELLVSMAVMLIVTGAIVQLVSAPQGASQVQPEAQDVQQRMRVAADALFKDLVMAGAGPYLGPAMPAGSLARWFPSLIPHRTGASAADAFDSAYDARITIAYVPQTSSQTTISQALADPAGPLVLAQSPNCPAGQPLCGLSSGDQVLVFDQAGHFDTFTIAAVNGGGADLQLHGQVMSTTYLAGTPAARVETHQYFVDSTTSQLMHSVGSTAAASPVADNVVGLKFEYFGDPSPPVRPKPPAGTANCLYDEDGHYRAAMQTLLDGDGSLASLPLSMFTDGPWCGGGSNLFDADLLRVRRVAVTIRVQTPLAALRGQNTALFAFPGTSRDARRMVPDLVVRFSVSPRNLNLDR